VKQLDCDSIRSEDGVALDQVALERLDESAFVQVLGGGLRQGRLHRQHAGAQRREMSSYRDHRALSTSDGTEAVPVSASARVTVIGRASLTPVLGTCYRRSGCSDVRKKLMIMASSSALYALPCPPSPVS
jgi:hypothetical protein